MELFAFWVILHAFLLSADSFQNEHFKKKLSLSNGFDPNQAQHFVMPGLSPIKLFCKLRQMSPLVGKELSLQPIS